jgi:surface protein
VSNDSYTSLFANSPLLDTIYAYNCNESTVNRFIAILVSRVNSTPGTLYVNDSVNLSNIDVSAANKKNWNIAHKYEILVADYTCNSSELVVPTFESTYDGFSIRDIVSDDGLTTRRRVYHSNLPTKISFDLADSLISVDYLNTSNATDLSFLFRDCVNLVSVATETMDVSNVNDMHYMFDNCPLITELDLSGWNTSNVTTMEYMFNDCTGLTNIIGLENWDTSSLVLASYMFYNCNQITNFDGVTNWNMVNVNPIDRFFAYCSSVSEIDLRGWKNISPTTVRALFSHCTSLKTIYLDKWNLDIQLSDGMEEVVNNCTSLTEIYVRLSTAATINTITKDIPDRTGLTPGIVYIAGVDDESAIDINNLTQNNWIIDNTTYPKVLEYTMVAGANIIPVFNAEFTDYDIVDTVINNKTTRRLITSVDIPTAISFEGNKNLLTIVYMDTSRLTNMDKMFYGCESLTSVNSYKWDTSKVTSMNAMFRTCYKLTSVDVSRWDTSNVNDMSNMFTD